MPPFFPPFRRRSARPANKPVTAARPLDDGAPTQGRRQRHRPGSCHNGPLHPSLGSYALHLRRGVTKGGRASPVRETSAPSHLTLTAAPLQRSCSRSSALLRAGAHHHAGALLRGRATPASPNDSIMFVRPSNVLALFVRAGGSPRPRHSALTLKRGVSVSRTTASTTISTVKSKKEAHPQDPTIRQLKLS